MRLYVGAAVVVGVVVGAGWLALALAFSHSLSAGGDAYSRSASCVRGDRSLSADPAGARRFRASGLQPLAIRWNRVEAVALFADSLSPDSVDRIDARITARLERRGVSPGLVAQRLLHQDNLSLYYVTGAPSRSAQAAIGRCVYLVHYNRIASAMGLYLSPHAERPFLPGAHRED
jgi:hypothetical protein